MELDLRQLPCVLLTINRNTDRHARMRAFFAAYGYKHVRWIFGKPTANHHHGAKQMALDTLSSITCPTFWLEDDAQVLPNYKTVINVPDVAQVAYLGGHIGGKSRAAYNLMKRSRDTALAYGAKASRLQGTRNAANHRGWFRDTEYPDWIRILSMWGGHAIIWLDDTVRRAMIDHIRHEDKAYDIGMSIYQWKYRIYGLRKPFFYQRDGHNDQKTQGYC